MAEGLIVGSLGTSNKNPKLTNLDLLFRVQQTGSTPITFAVTAQPTESIARPFANLARENFILKEAIKNLWYLCKYNQEYQSFLLGSCSEDEFLIAAERHATSFQSMETQQIILASSLLLHVLNESLTSSDLSTLLNVDPFDIERAMASSSHVGLVTLGRQEGLYGNQR